MTRMTVSMSTAARSSTITTPHIVPVMIIIMSELERETRVGSVVFGELPVATEAVELDENSLPGVSSGRVVLSTIDSPTSIEVMHT